MVVRIDPRYFRPEVDTLLGDPTKAKEKLGWMPEITAQEMCAEMVVKDLKAAKRQALLNAHQMSLPISQRIKMQRLFLTGGSGMVGRILTHRGAKLGYFSPTSAELDLTNPKVVYAYIKMLSPISDMPQDMCGIQANMAHPVDFGYQQCHRS